MDLNFFGFYNPVLVFVLIGITFFTYVFARKIDDSIETVVKKVFLVLSIILSIGVLFVFKYFNAVSQGVVNILNIFSLGLDDIYLNLIVPLGVSFFTLRAVAYVVDVYRKKMPPEKHIGYYALYLAFFPTLLAGPIEKPAEFIDHLKKKKPFAGYDAANGLKMLAIGFFKVTVVSRQVSVYVDRIFASANQADVNITNGFVTLLGILMFIMQIYCDFSGYANIGVGCASLMGIRVSENFRAPYLAGGIRELQSSWNVSVNSWFNDYVYQPICKDSASVVKRYVALVIVFLLGALWYGSDLTFLLFGAINLVLFIVAELTDSLRANIVKMMKIKRDNFFLKLIKRVVLFIIVVIMAALFRAEDMESFGIIMSNLFGGWAGINIGDTLSALGMSVITLVTIVISSVAAIMLDYQIVRNANDLRISNKLRVERAQVYLVLAWAVLIAFIMLLATGISNGYVYFVF